MFMYDAYSVFCLHKIKIAIHYIILYQYKMRINDTESAY